MSPGIYLVTAFHLWQCFHVRLVYYLSNFCVFINLETISDKYKNNTTNILVSRSPEILVFGYECLRSLHWPAWPCCFWPPVVSPSCWLYRSHMAALLSCKPSRYIPPSGPSFSALLFNTFLFPARAVRSTGSVFMSVQLWVIRPH